MGFKKKMGIGIMAGALGVSLIGGGTWAAFNDVETVNNSFTAGTLDLVVDKEVVFDLENLKPGDYFTRTLTLSNAGSLTIDDILLSTSASGWEDVLDTRLSNEGSNTMEDFLAQFNVTIDRDGTQVYTGTLSGLSALSGVDVTGTGVGNPGLASGGDSTFTINVTFVDDPTIDSGRLLDQNRYQGEAADLALHFEATQMPGEDRSND